VTEEGPTEFAVLGVAAGAGEAGSGGYGDPGLAGGARRLEVEVRGECGPGDDGWKVGPKPSPGFRVPGEVGPAADEGKGDGTLNEPVTGEPNVPVMGVFA